MFQTQASSGALLSVLGGGKVQMKVLTWLTFGLDWLVACGLNRHHCFCVITTVWWLHVDLTAL